MLEEEVEGYLPCTEFISVPVNTELDTSSFSMLSSPTRWTLDEYLLFQRRLCRKGVVVMSKQKPRVKVLCVLTLGFFMRVPYFGLEPKRIGKSSQAVRMSICTHHFCLLESILHPSLKTEFHSATAHFANFLLFC